MYLQLFSRGDYQWMQLLWHRTGCVCVQVPLFVCAEVKKWGRGCGGWLSLIIKRNRELFWANSPVGACRPDTDRVQALIKYIKNRKIWRVYSATFDKNNDCYDTYTMPLQQRVHWGSFWSPGTLVGMGLPSLGNGDLIGDLRFLILSVGDTPRNSQITTE